MKQQINSLKMKQFLIFLFLLTFTVMVNADCVWSKCGDRCKAHPVVCDSQACGAFWGKKQYWCCEHEDQCN
jgi:hypothetical protein